MSQEARSVQFNIAVRVVKIGGGYVAMGAVAGAQFRGNRRSTQVAAAQDLLAQFLGQNIDAELALDMACAGEDMSILEADLTAALANEIEKEPPMLLEKGE